MAYYAIYAIASLRSYVMTDNAFDIPLEAALKNLADPDRLIADIVIDLHGENSLTDLAICFAETLREIIIARNQSAVQVTRDVTTLNKQSEACRALEIAGGMYIDSLNPDEDDKEAMVHSLFLNAIPSDDWRAYDLWEQAREIDDMDQAARRRHEAAVPVPCWSPYFFS